MPRVLITVPHATASAVDDERWRTSDERALAAARSLERALGARGIAVTVLEGDEPRARCDLNRDGRCDSSDEFKQRYLAELDTHEFVVDAHSFPNAETWGRPVAPDVAVLYDSRYRRLSDAVVATLREADVDAVLVAGAPNVNFIITEASRRSVPNLLLEVHEDRAHERATEALAVFIASLQFIFYVD